MAKAKGDCVLVYHCDERISRKRTISRYALGNSKPITDLPGITSTTRTLITDKERAKSFAKTC